MNRQSYSCCLQLIYILKTIQKELIPMASNITRKRKRSAASESAASSLGSQESVSADFDSLDSGSESTFKKPRMKAKLQLTGGSFLPDCFELRMEIDRCVFPNQKVRPVTDNYVIDLVVMIKTLSEVATCKKGKSKYLK